MNQEEQSLSKPATSDIEARGYQLFLARGGEHARDVAPEAATAKEKRQSDMDRPRYQATAMLTQCGVFRSATIEEPVSDRPLSPASSGPAVDQGKDV